MAGLIQFKKNNPVYKKNLELKILMRKLVTPICILIVLLQSCTGSKKATQLPPYIIPDLPYGALDRKGMESSNDKEILLYFINDQTLTLRPGQITEAEFWASPEIWIRLN